MSSSRPPPIRDFASLKRVWDSESTNPQTDADAVATRAQSSLPPDGQANTPQPHSSQLESQHTVPIERPDQSIELEKAKSVIADLWSKNRSLEEDVSRLQEQLVSKLGTIDLLARDLKSADERLDRCASFDGQLKLLEETEKELIADRASLKADRVLFERELDELDQIKRRESEVVVRESSIKKAQEELERRRVAVGDLEALRSELNEKLLAAEAVLADYKKTETDLRSAKRQMKKKSDETEALAAELEQLKGKFKRLEERHRILKAEHSEVQDQCATASEALEERTKELESSRSKMDRLRVERDQVKALLASMPELNITNEALLHWLAQDGTPECIDLDEDSQLGWSGVGSYDADAFDRLLIELGIQQYALPHPSITHVVVGRVGWSKEDLLTQIDMRQGKTLRVYSQEMLLAALITGRDPLDCEDPEVLDSFKMGHPALEFLAVSELEWPSLSASDTSEINVVGPESLGATESPLHALGYKVGETSWLSQEERQEILREAFEMEDLPWVESDAYMEKWGSARSHQRLWRIAFHLAMLLNGPVGRDWRKPQTKSDWLEDLDWLHEKFYKRRKFRFTWPDVNVA
jgi:hypothetical protein